MPARTSDRDLRRALASQLRNYRDSCSPTDLVDAAMTVGFEVAHLNAPWSEKRRFLERASADFTRASAACTRKMSRY